MDGRRAISKDNVKPLLPISTWTALKMQIDDPHIHSGLLKISRQTFELAPHHLREMERDFLEMIDFGLIVDRTTFDREKQRLLEYRKLDQNQRVQLHELTKHLLSISEATSVV